MICLSYGVLEKKLKNFIMGSVKKIDLFIVVNIRIYYTVILIVLPPFRTEQDIFFEGRTTRKVKKIIKI